jgi:hypothetical protein
VPYEPLTDLSTLTGKPGDVRMERPVHDVVRERYDAEVREGITCGVTYEEWLESQALPYLRLCDFSMRLGGSKTWRDWNKTEPDDGG